MDGKIEQGTEVVKAYISKEVLENLYQRGILKSEQYQIIAVEPYGEAYPNDEQWAKLKSEADKAYKKLKKRAFELRDSDVSFNNDF